MAIETIAADLLAAISTMNLVPQRPGIASSDYVRIVSDGKGLSFTLASEVRGEHKVKAHKSDSESWSFWVERQLLFPFLGISKANVAAVVSFACVPGKTLTVKIGRRVVVLKALTDIAGYDAPSTKGEKEFTVPSKFRTVVQQGGEFATTDKTDEHLQCVYLTGTHAIASNKTSAIKLPCKTDYQGPIPLGFTSFMRFGEDDKLYQTPRGLIVRFGQGYIFQAYSSACRDKFPHAILLESVEKLSKKPTLFKSPGHRFDSVIRFFQSVCGIAIDPHLLFTGSKGDTRIKVSSLAAQANFSETLQCEPLPGDIKEELRLKPLASMTPLKEDTVDVRGTQDSNYYVKYGKTEIVLGRKAKPTKSKKK